MEPELQEQVERLQLGAWEREREWKHDRFDGEDGNRRFERDGGGRCAVAWGVWSRTRLLSFGWVIREF